MAAKLSNSSQSAAELQVKQYQKPNLCGCSLKHGARETPMPFLE